MRWFHIEGFSDLRSVRPVGWTVTSRSQKAPHQIGRIFQKENPFLRKIETGEQPENTKEKMDWCFPC
jgi:hypothetical protein